MDITITLVSALRDLVDRIVQQGVPTHLAQSLVDGWARENIVHVENSQVINRHHLAAGDVDYRLLDCLKHRAIMGLVHDQSHVDNPYGAAYVAVQKKDLNADEIIIRAKMTCFKVHP